jgi:signal recognition particle receptor subunit beta
MSQIGSGALPVDQLPSHGLVIRAAAAGRISNALGVLEQRLRALPLPVIGRVAQDALWLDLRCLDDHQRAALRRSTDQLAHSMIVGTAGHIDHGKTTLTRALTGVDTDRLKEEKARGISIELGYAYAPLENGDVLGVIDVPGHEKFIRTMAAGVTGIDAALLVVAADDGIMPQTLEHLAILRLLGVTRGAVALTKTDRADAPASNRSKKTSTRCWRRPISPAPPSSAPTPPMTGTTASRRCWPSGRNERRAAGQRRARLFRLGVDRVFTCPARAPSSPAPRWRAACALATRWSWRRAASRCGCAASTPRTARRTPAAPDSAWR